MLEASRKSKLPGVDCTGGSDVSGWAGPDRGEDGASLQLRAWSTQLLLLACCNKEVAAKVHTV